MPFGDFPDPSRFGYIWSDAVGWIAPMPAGFIPSSNYVTVCETCMFMVRAVSFETPGRWLWAVMPHPTHAALDVGC